MDHLKGYTTNYYKEIATGSVQSAKEVIPVLLSFLSPASVIDVGCGTGAWLSIWKQKGVKDILGVDNVHISSQQLLIEPGEFITAELEKPLQLDRKFDLVTSLEVAEHLDANASSVFIRSLCELGDIVVFSAAVPGQGGVHHINEQYPTYWIALFRQNGFSVYDCIREKIWDNKKIDTCYRQNILFFVRDAVKDKYASITSTKHPVLDIVHPEHYDQKENVLQTYKAVLRTPFHAGWYFIKKFFTLFKPRH